MGQWLPELARPNCQYTVSLATAVGQNWDEFIDQHFMWLLLEVWDNERGWGRWSVFIFLACLCLVTACTPWAVVLSLCGWHWRPPYKFPEAHSLCCHVIATFFCLFLPNCLQVAGSLVLDLNWDGTHAEPCEADDRRFVFHIIAPVAKKWVLQDRLWYWQVAKVLDIFCHACLTRTVWTCYCLEWAALSLLLSSFSSLSSMPTGPLSCKPRMKEKGMR